MMRSVLYGALFIAGVWAATPSHAAATSGYSASVTQSGNVFTLVPKPSNASNAATYSVSGSSVAISQAVVVPLTSSVAMNLATVATIAGAAIAGPWGAALTVLGTAVMMALPSFQSFYSKNGIVANPDGSMSRPDPNVCTVAPCYQYASAGYGFPQSAWYNSPAQLCAWGVGQAISHFSYRPIQSYRNYAGGTGAYCEFAVFASDGVTLQYSNLSSNYRATTAATSAPLVPVTPAQVQSLISAAPVAVDQVKARR